LGDTLNEGTEVGEASGETLNGVAISSGTTTGTELILKVASGMRVDDRFADKFESLRES